MPQRSDPGGTLPAGSGTEWFEAADYDSDAGHSYSSALESGPSLAAGIPEADAEPEGSRLHLLLLQGLGEQDRLEGGHNRHAGADTRSAVCLALSYAQPEAGTATAYAAGSGLSLCVFTEVGKFLSIFKSPCNWENNLLCALSEAA